MRDTAGTGRGRPLERYTHERKHDRWSVRSPSFLLNLGGDLHLARGYVHKHIMDTAWRDDNRYLVELEGNVFIRRLLVPVPLVFSDHYSIVGERTTASPRDPCKGPHFLTESRHRFSLAAIRSALVVSTAGFHCAFSSAA